MTCACTQGQNGSVVEACVLHRAWLSLHDLRSKNRVDEVRMAYKELKDSIDQDHGKHWDLRLAAHHRGEGPHPSEIQMETRKRLEKAKVGFWSLMRRLLEEKW